MAEGLLYILISATNRRYESRNLPPFFVCAMFEWSLFTKPFPLWMHQAQSKWTIITEPFFLTLFGAIIVNLAHETFLPHFNEFSAIVNLKVITKPFPVFWDLAQRYWTIITKPWLDDLLDTSNVFFNVVALYCCNQKKNSHPFKWIFLTLPWTHLCFMSIDGFWDIVQMLNPHAARFVNDYSVIY